MHPGSCDNVAPESSDSTFDFHRRELVRRRLQRLFRVRTSAANAHRRQL